VDVRKPTSFETVASPLLAMAQCAIVTRGGKLAIIPVDVAGPSVLDLDPTSCRVHLAQVHREEERLVNQVVLTSRRDQRKATVTVNLAYSRATWGQRRPLTIDASILPENRLRDVAENVAERLFGWFARPYLTLSVETTVTEAWDVQVGQIVTLTAQIPAPGGALGVVGLRCLVTSTQRSVGGEYTSRLGLVAPHYSGALLSGYAPALPLGAYAGAGVYAHAYTYWGLFTVGDAVEVWPVGEHDAFTSATITGITSTSITLNPDPGAGAVGYLVSHRDLLAGEGDPAIVFIDRRRIWL
jgi:hypothetical protein